MHHAMRGKDHQAGAIHVDKGHHGEFVSRRVSAGRNRLGDSSIGPSSRCRGTTLIAIIQGGLISMVTVRNNQLLVLHLRTDNIQNSRFGDLPDLMLHSILVS